MRDALGDPGVLLDTARQAAEAGGQVLTERAADQGARRSKSSATDFVTDADIASGIAVVDAIRERRPHARFLIEEVEVYDLASAPVGCVGDPEVWVIDPLDGTTSFIHGFPCYSVAIALLRDGKPVVGVVHDVARGETYYAARGLGAFRDGRPIRVSGAERVSDALLVTGFPYDRGEPLTRQLSVLAAFLRTPVHGIRRDGSAAVDCCHVAGGRADGFWEYTLKPWDMAAGAIVLAEAGAVISDVEGGQWSPDCGGICAANPVLHPQLVDVIRGASA